MNELNKKLEKIKSDSKSNWQENAKYRLENRWLEYSSQIARRVIAVIKDKKGLTQVKIADSLGVSPQQINKIVKGKENLTLETIYNLSQVLGVELISFPDYKYGNASNFILNFTVPIENNNSQILDNIIGITVSTTNTTEQLGKGKLVSMTTGASVCAFSKAEAN